VEHPVGSCPFSQYLASVPPRWWLVTRTAASGEVYSTAERRSTCCQLKLKECEPCCGPHIQDHPVPSQYVLKIQAVGMFWCVSDTCCCVLWTVYWVVIIFSVNCHFPFTCSHSPCQPSAHSRCPVAVPNGRRQYCSSIQNMHFAASGSPDCSRWPNNRPPVQY